MKKSFFAIFILNSLAMMAQQSPVQWNFDIVSAGDNIAEFKATATITPGWNIYAVYMSDEGPIPTSFTFEDVKNGKLEGEIVEKSKQIKGFDPLFDMEVIKFKGKAEFSQSVKKDAGGKTQLQGYVTYMTCDNHKCLPPVDVPFNVKL